jgi:hypothetical protein
MSPAPIDSSRYNGGIISEWKIVLNPGIYKQKINRQKANGTII